MTHQEYADSLRQVADFFEAHPDFPLPYDNNLSICSVDTPEEIAPLVRALGSVKKDYSESLVTISKSFGAVDIRILATRSRFCKKVITGKKVVPAKTIPEQVIPEHEEDVFEWKCDESILAHSEAVDA